MSQGCSKILQVDYEDYDLTCEMVVTIDPCSLLIRPIPEQSRDNFLSCDESAGPIVAPGQLVPTSPGLSA